MDYKEFASDLPLDRTFAFTSVEENEETIQRWGVKQEMRQIGRGAFRSDLAVRMIDQAELYADRFNKALSMRLEPPKGAVGILFPRSASGKFLLSGQNVGNGRLAVIPYGSGADIVIPNLAGSEAITMPVERFSAMCEVLSPSFGRPEGLAIFKGDATQLHHLHKAVIALVSHPELEPSDEQLSNLLTATVAWIDNCTNQDWRFEELQAQSARIRVAKLAQEYIEAHYHDAVRMEDLCRVTAIGLRTLQRCFREYFDLTITEYLKTVRLNAAHRDLVAAHRGEHSVTDIAIKHGFNHLGRFSVEFRQRFGVSPKHMLAMRGANLTGPNHQVKLL